MKKIIFLLFFILALFASVGYAAVPDSDQDGVPDANDQCPDSNTTVVDQFGCSCQQKNCPSDNNVCTDDCSVVNGLANCGFVNNNNQCPGGYCYGRECLESTFSVSGIVFIDNNGNGVFDAGDGRFAGRTVYIRNLEDTFDIKAPATTDSNGNYAFTGLPAGKYRVRHNVPEGYVRTNDDSKPFLVPPNLNRDFGIKKGREVCGDGFCIGFEDCTSCPDDCGTCPSPAFILEPSGYSISGTVFIDKNGNGIIDEDDDAFPSTTVYLRNRTDNADLKAPTTTDSSGRYIFSGLSEGEYRIKHIVPDGYIRTTDDSRPYFVDKNNKNIIHDFGISLLPHSCSSKNGYICDGIKVCLGTKIDASNTDRCCSVPCATRSWNFCSECGNGLFNVCDKLECNSVSEGCYFVDNLIVNKCESCSGSMCKNYADQATCIEDHCGLGSCSWSGNSCVTQSTSCENSLKNEFFDKDPGWDSANNLPNYGECKQITQDFGFSNTNYAGLSLGELGGLISRSVKPAYYGDDIGTLTLNDSLVASGTFSLANSDDGVVSIGWFNSERQGWRPVNFLGFRFDGQTNSAIMHVDYTTKTWRAGGLGTRVKILADSSKHLFKIEYDPNSNFGNGRIIFTLDNSQHILNLAPGHKDEGALFNRFGIFNGQKSAGATSKVYFDDLEYKTKQGIRKQDFSTNPGWDSKGNRISFEDCEIYGNQNFGFSNTNFAGSNKGEMGGLFWRLDESNKAIHYGDVIKELTMNDYLEASGSISFVDGASDSGMQIGWFDSEGIEKLVPKSFIGILVEGPSAIGHYFRPKYTTPSGNYVVPAKGPVILPNGVKHQWRIIYDPSANNKQGRITVYLDNEVEVLDLPSGHKQDGVKLNRFGIFPLRASGAYIKIYFDDISYTSESCLV